jgi:hypothetical protein
MRVEATARLAEWEAINDLAGGFQDTCVRELWVNSTDWVHRDLRMVFDEPSLVTVLIQSQFTDVPPLLLRFSGVRQLHMDPQLDARPIEVERLEGPARRDERLAWRVRRLTLEVVAEGCQAQQVDEVLTRTAADRVAARIRTTLRATGTIRTSA